MALESVTYIVRIEKRGLIFSPSQLDNFLKFIKSHDLYWGPPAASEITYGSSDPNAPGRIDSATFTWANLEENPSLLPVYSETDNGSYRIVKFHAPYTLVGNQDSDEILRRAKENQLVGVG